MLHVLFIPSINILRADAHILQPSDISYDAFPLIVIDIRYIENVVPLLNGQQPQLPKVR